MKNASFTDITGKVIAHCGERVHPRIMLTDADFAAIRDSDDIIRVRGAKNVIHTAESYMQEPVETHRLPDGLRLLSISRSVLRRTLNLGMAYRLTGDVKYAERLWQEIEAVCAFPDWNPNHFLDVGEMCNAVGIAYDWIYDYLDDGQRATVRRALREKGFNQVMDDYLNRERRRTYRWYQDTPGDNWKFVCNGGITVALLAVCDEGDIDGKWVDEMFNYAFTNTYDAVRDMYLPDGSYVEGFTYWHYATIYLAYYTSAMKSALGTDFGLTDHPTVPLSAHYIRAICSNRFICFNFGDAQEVSLCVEPYFWIGKNYSAPEITEMRAAPLRRDPDQVCVRDLLWYTPNEGAELALPECSCGSVGGTNAAFRTGWDVEGEIYAAIHFGCNWVCHAHADMGSFVVEYDGKRFFSDLGQDNYNVPNYRNAYRYRAEGHNTLVINPDHGADQVYKCESYISDYRPVTPDADGIAVCDMSVAYPGKRVVRGMRINGAAKTVTVQDEIGLADGDVAWWFGHTEAEIALSEDARLARLTIDGSTLEVRIISDGACFEVMKAEHLIPELVQPTQNNNSKYRKLAVRMTESCTLAVAFGPDTSSATLAPISEW